MTNVRSILLASAASLVIVGSAMPSKPYVAQPVHLWALTGSTWRQLDATTAGG